ncbi:MAG: hypothetical protein RML92_07330 [Bacteroidia bacterium]|nr:hypothetical protein [Bacteroidia bacterium]
MLRRWHFLLARPLSDNQKTALHSRLMIFLSQWSSHGRPVRAEVSFPFNQIIEVATEDSVSGCAIDELFHYIHEVVKDMALTLLPTDYVCVFLDGIIFSEKFYEIIKKYKAGDWPPEARIVDMDQAGVRLVPIEHSRIAIHLK